MKTITICIPTYEMKGLGVNFLEQSFAMLKKQTFKDFDIVISDHSKDNNIEILCAKYENILTINYFRNTNNYGNSSANINNAIKKATGSLIKILFQDDFLYHKNSLKDIIDNFNLEVDNWLVTPCIHTRDGVNFFKPFYPHFNKYIHLGNNTISSPSVVTIKNNGVLLFDENLLWLMDTEYYKRYYNSYGLPKIISEINVVNRSGIHQVSKTLATLALRNHEYLYVLKKYEHGFPFWYYRITGFIKQIMKKLFISI